jgi:hypothetical protein
LTGVGSDGFRKGFMPKGFLRICLLAGCFLPTSPAATAQEVIHALVGTVSSIDSTEKTIVVKTDDGFEGRFKDIMNPRRKIVWDKNARTDAAASNSFKKTGERVIVYYFGVGDSRTIVALRSLGPGTVTKTAGKVVSFDKRSRLLSITNQSGEAESFEIASDTVVDTEMGAVAGLEFRPAKDDPVRVTAAVVNGTRTALFISAMAAY